MSQNHVKVITQLHHRPWKKVAMNLYDLNQLQGLRHQLLLLFALSRLALILALSCPLQRSFRAVSTRTQTLNDFSTTSCLTRVDC